MQLSPLSPSLAMNGTPVVHHEKSVRDSFFLLSRNRKNGMHKKLNAISIGSVPAGRQVT